MTILNNASGDSGMVSVPEGPAVVPVVGPPVGWAEAHRDLEDLRVHDVSHHPEETCGKQTGGSEETGRHLRKVEGKS